MTRIGESVDEPTTTGSRHLRDAVDKVLPKVLDDLRRMISVPGVSFPEFDPVPVEQSAETVARLCRESGIEDVRIIRAGGGHPAVVARIPAPPGAPTVLLYAHHDVQPAGDIGEWHSEPFVAEERDGRLYGRGAADDKGGIAAHLAAVRAFGGRPPVGVTLFIEGEEECGSPSLRKLLADHHELLTADVIVLADSENWRVGVPALTISLRGLVDCRVRVSTLEHSVHSGIYGGVVPDALTSLCRLLSTLHDDAGDVAVAGLHRSGAPAVSQTEASLRAQAGVLPEVDLIGTGSVTERRWHRPAITVIGIDCPGIRDAANKLIATAEAKVSMRLAPGQDPLAAMSALTSHLITHAPWHARVAVEPGHLSAPSQIVAHDGIFQAGLDALRDAWDGQEPVTIGVGGSIPFVVDFATAFSDAAMLVTGVQDPDTRAHSADESLHLGEWRRACLATAFLLERLARDPE